MRIPEFYKVIVYLVLNGVMIPSFGSFGYYFFIDVLMISKSTIAVLSIVGFVSTILGSVLYQLYF